MITAEEARALASEKESGNLNLVLDIIKENAKLGAMEVDLPIDIKLTYSDKVRLRNLGYHVYVSNQEGQISVVWG